MNVRSRVPVNMMDLEPFDVSDRSERDHCRRIRMDCFHQESQVFARYLGCVALRFRKCGHVIGNGVHYVIERTEAATQLVLHIIAVERLLVCHGGAG